MTMKTPEMEVVRFNESDVIVASSNLRAQNFNNGNPGDALINGESVTSFVRALETMHANTNVYFQYNGNNPVNGKDLLANEENNSLKDGIYSESTKDGEVWWKWISQ